MARYSATRGFAGDNLLLGRLSCKQGHTSDGRERVSNLMREDPEDKVQVENWESDHRLTGHAEVEDMMDSLADEVGTGNDGKSIEDTTKPNMHHSKGQFVNVKTEN